MEKFSDVNKKLLNQYIWPYSKKQYLKAKLYKADNYYVYKFLYYTRKFEWLEKKGSSYIYKFRRLLCLRKANKYANICGYVISPDVLGPDVVLYHKGSIIINPDTKMGSGCKFHGDCCIGVARTGEEGCPVLGNNVDVGIGAKVLGNIYIADDIVIGANAVVTKSFYEPGITIAGIPARKIK